MLLSLVLFGLYGWDKYRAKSGGFRIPESQLLLISFLGGWPGAWIGQKLFRHKTRVFKFKICTILSALLHVAFLLIVFFSYR
ncbi:MAG: DUF1294 domain-containing protein [Planctomycetota bacterium]